MVAKAFDVIAFGAHPDDAEAACGGLLVKLVRRGYAVAICDLTRGELATNGSVEERDAEAQAAAHVLGVARYNLGLPDGGVRADDPEQLGPLVGFLRTHAPRLVVAPHAAARHPDHVQAAELVRRARFWCGVPRYAPETGSVARPVLVHCLDFHPMTPSFVVDITSELDTKLRALECYRSQFDPGGSRHPTVLNAPGWLERLSTHAKSYGALIGRPAGEPYALDTTVPLDDPVAALAPTRELRP